MTKLDAFTALVLTENDGIVSSAIETVSNDRLPDHSSDQDVTVAVTHSTLNYKDGLIISGLGGLVRDYPHLPGVDFCGVVEDSASPKYKPGDEVILTGWRVGEVHWGGYATRARVKADWLVPLPNGMSLEQSMAIGTAGFSAMLAVMELEDHGLTPESEGEVLVTGAAGGVGSIAVAVLAERGYKVAASTGRKETHGYLKDLGATTIIKRAELETPPEGPLGSARWAGAIDNVGGTTLATVLATLNHRASCSAVGLAASGTLNTTVIPFLLRGVNLLGIDSSFSPAVERATAWRRLATELPKNKLAEMTTIFGLGDLPDLAKKILDGAVRGRTVIDTHKK